MRAFALRRAALKAPFPWFGGKSRVAGQVWPRFGEVRNYVEPFFGSGAVLLARPGEPGIETVNDVDAFLANFWRAVAADPDQVAHYADWPVNEADLHARHRWLVETARERVEQLKTDPDLFDPKVAGWWVWGQCLWIGSGWCAGRLSAQKPYLAGTGSSDRGVNGVKVTEFGKLPAIAGRDGGRGAYAKSRHANGTDAEKVVDWQPRPDLSGPNRGILRQAQQVPDLSGDAGAAGRGIHASGFEAKYGKRPALGSMGGNNGVHRVGIHLSSGGLEAYMRALSDRLRRVRVCCGDFERVLGPAVTTCIGLTGVFLDPPYPEDGRAICYSHDGDGVWWRAYQWAIDHGDDPLLRIALCGYEHPDAVFPAGWEEVAWKASGGYGRSDRGKANARRERLWFSPGCLRGEQGHLFNERLQQEATHG